MTRLGAAACLVVAGAARSAQPSAQPATEDVALTPRDVVVAQRPRDVVGVTDGTPTYIVARLLAGRLEPALPCVPTDAPLDALALTRVVAAVPAIEPRPVQVGSDEWNQLSPRILALAERREREQRLAQATTARAPRFLDWLFASDAGGRATYYFEVSRRVPSVAAPLDVDVDTDPPGTVRVVVSGFVRGEASGLSALATKGELRWEQDGLPRGPSRPDLRPLGVLTLPGDPVWVMEGRTPVATWVRMVAVGARGVDVRVTTRIGGC